MEGKRATARRARGQEGKAHRQNENILLNETEYTHTHTQFFSEYRLSGSLPSGSHFLALIILSLYVCMYTCRSIHHTHTDTQTFSVYVSLSFVYVCDRERGGGPLSLDVCVRMSGGVVDENGGGEFKCILKLLAS